MLNIVLHRVGMSWIIATNKQLEYDMDKHNSYWMTGGSLYNTYICKKLYGKMFEEFIRNARIDRYNLICSIGAHEYKNQSLHDDEISSGGYPIPSSSTTEVLVSLSPTLDLIGCWLQALEHNFLERCNMYIFPMKNTFQRIPVEIPKPPSPKEKYPSLYMLLEVVGI